MCKKKKLYCAFVDYKKAFDSVDRIALWQKLQKYNLDGKFLVIVRNMYGQAKSCVRLNGNCSQFFKANVGVRQGENLSPVLFSIFLNDLTDFLSNAYNGMEHISNLAQQTFPDDDLIVYFKLYVLLYADDTVVFAESRDELQAALNGLFLYCKTWNLNVNSSKTKVVVFSKNKCTDTPVSTFGDQVLGVEEDFVYLGISFDYKGQFFKARNRLIEQAKKALFAVVNKIRKLGLPCDIQLKLFDMMIAPILLYGAEVWGYENCEIIEAFHFKFCKTMLGLKAATPKVMVYGELGRLPMQVSIQTRMINFWSKIVCGKEDKLSYRLYRIMYYMDEHGYFHSQWLNSIRTILQNCNLDLYWYNQFQYPKLDFLKLKVKQKLKEIYCDK